MGRIMEAMLMIQRRVSTVDVLILENNNIPHLPSRWRRLLATIRGWKIESQEIKTILFVFFKWSKLFQRSKDRKNLKTFDLLNVLVAAKLFVS